MNVQFATLYGNTAVSGGGIRFEPANIDGGLLIEHSIVTNSTGGDCSAFGGSIAANNNLALGDCGDTSVTNLDPILKNNGGWTFTHALLENSNAVNASFGTCLNNPIDNRDQRGFARDLSCDLGAFEVQGGAPTLTPTLTTHTPTSTALRTPTLTTTIVPTFTNPPTLTATPTASSTTTPSSTPTPGFDCSQIESLGAGLDGNSVYVMFKNNSDRLVELKSIHVRWFDPPAPYAEMYMAIMGLQNVVFWEGTIEDNTRNPGPPPFTTADTGTMTEGYRTIDPHQTGTWAGVMFNSPVQLSSMMTMYDFKLEFTLVSDLPLTPCVITIGDDTVPTPRPTSIPTDTPTGTLPTAVPTETPTDTAIIELTDTPTITAVTPEVTETPSVTIIPSATPTPIVTDLLLNGGFETDGDNDHQPDSWQGKHLTGDNRKCNHDDIVVAFEGVCAYQFKGSSGENAKLVQKIAITGLSFNTGDQLLLSAQINGKGVAIKGKLKAQITYTDTSLETDKIKLNLIPTGGYTLMTGSTSLKSGALMDVRVVIQNKSVGGKLRVDAIQLFWKPGSVSLNNRMVPVPLP
ncbi:MAG TPA: choice-of-anchor Q domain-containing protein [Phototrophicaceae bacterium]|jgi:hypothetical protein|nr:choice-of-anchor Q domain-containing protein [Phototrophicaceae bacterium]